MKPIRRTEIFRDSSALAEKTADWIASLIAAKAADSDFRIALSGGLTIGALYRALAVRELNWKCVSFFWVDERFVPFDHRDSNFRMAHELLFSKIPVQSEKIYPIPTSGDPSVAARAYEATLKKVYGNCTFDPARPLFDLVLLGMGSDGHICSLLPSEPVLKERTRWVEVVPKGRPEIRITLTYPTVQSSSSTAVYLAGPGKAAAMKAVRDGNTLLPATHLNPDGELIWLLDEAAASQL